MGESVEDEPGICLGAGQEAEKHVGAASRRKVDRRQCAAAIGSTAAARGARRRTRRRPRRGSTRRPCHRGPRRRPRRSRGRGPSRRARATASGRRGRSARRSGGGRRPRCLVPRRRRRARASSPTRSTVDVHGRARRRVDTRVREEVGQHLAQASARRRGRGPGRERRSVISRSRIDRAGIGDGVLGERGRGRPRSRSSGCCSSRRASRRRSSTSAPIRVLSCSMRSIARSSCSPGPGGRRRRYSSAYPRMAVTGVRSSCDASATNCSSRDCAVEPFVERGFELPEHVVERVGEATELGAVVGVIDPLERSPDGDGARGVDHPVDRAQRSPDHEPRHRRADTDHREARQQEGPGQRRHRVVDLR